MTKERLTEVGMKETVMDETGVEVKIKELPYGSRKEAE